ncbi:MAG: hypothetical protein M1839_008700 [Geoglossum umbratile]|nr:MAG: hypothetical protein M1839_008700 [Geoglossum umbratile]
MRNLLNIYQAISKISSSEAPDLPLVATAWCARDNDGSYDSLLCVFGPSEDSAVIDLKRLEPRPSRNSEESSWQLCNVGSWDAPCPTPGLVCDKVLDVHYFGDERVACLVLAGGDIVVVREEPNGGQDKIEIVGSVDGGITAAAWSPDEEILSISTCGDTFILMTRSFEVLTELKFSPDDLQASKHVSVGWGKSETQFKGKRVKALYDPTVPERVDEGRLSPFDKGEVQISWRGDGAYVAVSSVETSKRRLIRVYSRDGILDSASEPVDGLEGTLSWRPAGNLLAGIQRWEGRAEVVFFERNGLRHGQFDLRLTPKEMETWALDIELKWNGDSTVLAVCFRDRVQLWTMGNYHYYLKQEFRLPTPENLSAAATLSWHPEAPLRLAISLGGMVHILGYIFSCAGGSTSPPHDLGVVAVIDGRTLKLTPLQLANIPPPMALHEVSLESEVVGVSVSQTGLRIAILRHNAIDVLKWNLKAKPKPPPSRICTVSIANEGLVRQICFVGESDLFYLCSGPSETHIIGYRLDPPNGTCIRRLAQRSDFGIARIFAGFDHKRICIQSYDGRVEQADISGDFLGFSCIARSPLRQPRRYMSLTQVETVRHEGETVAFGLTDCGDLCANDEVLVKGSCTSFMMTPAHLIFTTAQHLLKFVHITGARKWVSPFSEVFMIPQDDPEVDERCRAIERGARLIAAMPTSFSLVLQMPRGNLETIFPRAIVLAGIRRSISSEKYITAFLACRSHRVDMNILHDHAPVQFMSNIGMFIDQVRKVEHIDLFLSQLKEEDVSETMYRETLRNDVVNGNISHLADGVSGSSKVASKVNRICDGFLEALRTREATNLQNIITAHVCKSPPDLDAGLSVVARLREGGLEAVERLVEHICFLADVNQLYDHALGLYDIDLALLVAQQSQMDPREYLPFLQKLQELPESRRKFSIDNHLSRFAKALRHLYELGAIDEVKEYTVKNQLYKNALELYRYQTERLNEIMRLYADYLNNQSNFMEAGIAFEYLTMYREAMSAYRAAGLWRETLFCATQASIPAAQIKELAIALAESLYEAKDYANAARVYLDYGQDVETAARTFCKGYLFADAMRIVGIWGREDLLETVIDQGLVDGLVASTELLADCKGQLLAQVPRLRELRAKKEEDSLAYYEGTPDADAPDNISLAPSNTSTSASLFTRYTGRVGTVNTQTTHKTSKNKRREERKRARGKKGSVYEEEYLINSIGRLVDRVDSVRGGVGRLAQGLLRRRMRERALAIETALNDVINLIRGCVGEVFEPGQKVRNAAVDGQVPKLGGANGVVQDSLEEAARPREPPLVRTLERLSLLGA